MTPTVEHLAADAPAFLPSPGADLEDRGRFVLRHFPGNPHPMSGLVLRPQLEPDAVGDAVVEARAWFRERGRAEFTWTVADPSLPADLGERLLRLGLRPDDRDPVYRGMVLEREPPPDTGGIEVRRAETFEDFLAGIELAWESFGMTEEQRAEARKDLREQRDRAGAAGQRQDTFLAVLAGRVVGSAGLQYAGVAGYLAGGNVAEAYRGRGVYRALVRARWDAAAAHGTPVLVAQAGRMSQPILERVGFRTVCVIRAFRDSTTA